MMQAGIAGYSDRAMRLVARRRGCPYAMTEALLDRIMLDGGQGLKKSIDINDEDHPVAGQVMGSEPADMAAAAAILADAGYDVIDLNFACPVKKVKNKARGGWMLKDLPRGTAILRACRDRLGDHPITVSLRRSFDDTPEAQDVFWQTLEAATSVGVAAVRVHGRTVEQKYAGRAKWPAIAEVKRRHPDLFLFGSGDVFEPSDVVSMLQETGCDAVWVARGAIGNPWIFRDAQKLLAMPADEDGSYRELLDPPTIEEQRDALQEHFALSQEIHGEQLAGRRMRKMGIKYSRFHPEHAQVKKAFIDVSSRRDWQRAIDAWYLSGGPGVWPAADAADEVNSDPSLQACDS